MIVLTLKQENASENSTVYKKKGDQKDVKPLNCQKDD